MRFTSAINKTFFFRKVLQNTCTMADDVVFEMLHMEIVDVISNNSDHVSTEFNLGVCYRE